MTVHEHRRILICLRSSHRCATLCRDLVDENVDFAVKLLQPIKSMQCTLSINIYRNCSYASYSMHTSQTVIRTAFTPCADVTGDVETESLTAKLTMKYHHLLLCNNNFHCTLHPWRCQIAAHLMMGQCFLFVFRINEKQLQQAMK